MTGKTGARADLLAEAGHRLMDTYAPAPVRFVRGEGARLYDDTGKEYLDFLCGIAVTGLGHAHPEVTRAICEQAGTLNHVSNLFANDRAPVLASMLDRLISDAARRCGASHHGRVFFANSGAEANECALKLARRHHGPGRHHVISLRGSFHGRTLATLAATGQPDKQEPFLPMPDGFIHVDPEDVDALIAASEQDCVGAVLLEPIRGEDGVHPCSAEYLKTVRAICDEKNIVMILDEVQTGLGRTGRWFGFEHSGVVPDVVTLAKSLGNGMPIGACWAREDVARSYRPGDHGSTFGGQPLAAAAALATLRAIEGEGLVDKAAATGDRMRDHLRSVPGVKGVRGAGMLIGVELEPGLDAREVATRALESGLVVNAIGISTIRIAPPLNLSSDDAIQGIGTLATAMAQCWQERVP